MSGRENDQRAVGSKRVRFGPAVSLSYDGSDPSHLEIVLPCLAEFGLNATFYVQETALLEHLQTWREAHAEGHEIACHSLFEAADGMGNLPKWTLENVEADLLQARKLFEELFPGQPDFSFAYPGVETLCMMSVSEQVETTFRPVVDKLFRVARSAIEGLADPAEGDLRFLESIDARDLSLDDLIVASEAAVFEQRWAIFAFRGIGAGEGAIDREAHRELCAWLKERSETLAVGPVYKIAMAIEDRRKARLV